MLPFPYNEGKFVRNDCFSGVPQICYNSLILQPLFLTPHSEMQCDVGPIMQFCSPKTNLLPSPSLVPSLLFLLIMKNMEADVSGPPIHMNNVPKPQSPPSPVSGHLRALFLPPNPQREANSNMTICRAA